MLDHVCVAGTLEELTFSFWSDSNCVYEVCKVESYVRWSTRVGKGLSPSIEHQSFTPGSGGGGGYFVVDP